MPTKLNNNYWLFLHFQNILIKMQLQPVNDTEIYLVKAWWCLMSELLKSKLTAKARKNVVCMHRILFLVVLCFLIMQILQSTQKFVLGILSILTMVFLSFAIALSINIPPHTRSYHKLSSLIFYLSTQ